MGGGIVFDNSFTEETIENKKKELFKRFTKELVFFSVGFISVVVAFFVLVYPKHFSIFGLDKFWSALVLASAGLITVFLIKGKRKIFRDWIKYKKKKIRKDNSFAIEEISLLQEVLLRT